MRVIVVGLGIQGKKRRAVAGADVVFTVDPFNEEADFRSVADVPLASFDAALLCIPDDPKISLIKSLVAAGKHVLVEKPLFSSNQTDLLELLELAKKHKVTVYTAYNHRFEPHFVSMKKVIEEKLLGKIYSVRMFYGNGTAALVRDSAWRDKGAGVLPDLGSHILDTLDFWFDSYFQNFRIITVRRFENQAPDHVSFFADESPLLQLEVTLLSWRNHFYADVYGEKGSAHISSLCKWGPSTFTTRFRKYPSGRPDEHSITFTQPDPTWEEEYKYFSQICKNASNNLQNDLWINHTLQYLQKDIL